LGVGHDAVITRAVESGDGKRLKEETHADGGVDAFAVSGEPVVEASFGSRNETVFFMTMGFNGNGGFRRGKAWFSPACEVAFRRMDGETVDNFGVMGDPSLLLAGADMLLYLCKEVDL
jgi:hypothetical protein